MENPQHIRLDVVEPEGAVLSEVVDECVIPGAGGSFGVRPGHTPFLTLLGTGEVMWRRGGERHYLAVAEGFCEVIADHVTVLARAAERAEEIDVARAERARDRAKEHLESIVKTGSGDEISVVRERLARAELRLKVAARRR
jgi:F-type H+-transporting ATPase subunit epsilon